MPAKRVTAHDAQAAAEGVPDDSALVFMGEEFILPDKIAYMAFLIFAKASKSGIDSADDAGMAAMYDMIHGCLAPDDEERFDRLALEKRATPDEMFDFVSRVMERVSARPTSAPTGSLRPAAKTSQKLRGASRSPDSAGELTPVGDLLS